MNDEIVDFVKEHVNYKYSRYVDSTLYLQCREYVKLCLVLEELILFMDFDSDELMVGEVVDNLVVKLGVLLGEIHISLLKIRDMDRDMASVMVVDRFNHKYGLGGLAELYDNESDFCIHVDNEDVERLDVLLNDLNSRIINLERANHNLNRRLLHLNDLINKKLEKCTDTDICNWLKTLQLNEYQYEK